MAHYDILSSIRIGTAEVTRLRDTDDGREEITVRHLLPPEPYDHRLNIAARAEVVLTVADFWQRWDPQARRDFALALTYIAGEMTRTTTEPGTDA